MSLLRGLRDLLFKNSFLLQILTTIRLIQVSSIPQDAD
jgi:hypothetical protein